MKQSDLELSDDEKIIKGSPVAICDKYAMFVGGKLGGNEEKYPALTYVHIFKREGNNWVEDAKITPSGLVEDFSSTSLYYPSLAISDHYAAASIGKTTFIFKRINNKWIELNKFDELAGRVSIVEDSIYIGNLVYTFSESTQIPGDVNGDGIVDLKDLMTCQKILTGTKSNPFYLEAVN
ncbi:MAG: hypothetical protein OMM_15345, partial [Candidatus Magnetoglobus multicellularis str. Araruama]